MKIIKYNIRTKVSRQTDEGIEFDEILNPVEIQCNTEESFVANLTIAKQEAFNGEYTVEDDGKSEAATTDDVLNALLGVTE